MSDWRERLEMTSGWARFEFRLRLVACWWFGHDIYVPTMPFQFRPLWCRRCAKSFDADEGVWR